MSLGSRSPPEVSDTAAGAALVAGADAEGAAFLKPGKLVYDFLGAGAAGASSWNSCVGNIQMACV